MSPIALAVVFAAASGVSPTADIPQSRGTATAPASRPTTRPAPPPGPAVCGTVRAPEGFDDVIVAFYDLTEPRTPEKAPERVITAEVGPDGRFCARVMTGRVYNVVPNTKRRPLFPASMALVAFGETARAVLDDRIGLKGKDRDNQPNGIEVFVRRAADDEVVELELALRSGGSIEVAVRDDTGAPLENLVFRVARPGDLQSGGSPTNEGEVPANGRLVLTGLLGRYEVFVWANDGRVAKSAAVVRAGETAKLELVLPKSGPIDGWVYSSGGTPVAGARVYLAPADSASFFESMLLEGKGFPLRPYTTGPNGGFGFAPTMKPGEYRVIVDADGFAFGRSEVVRPGEDGSRGIRVHLRPPVPLRGKVLDESGKPIEARLTVVPAESKDDFLGRSAEAEADGSFEFQRLAIGDYVLRAAAPGYGSAEKSVELLPGAESIEFRLARLGRVVKGRLVRTDGTPLPDPLDPSNAAFDATSDLQLEIAMPTDVMLFVVPRDPRAKGNDAFQDAEAALCLPDKTGEFTVAVKETPGPLWLALVACGRLEEVREVGAADAALEVRLDYDALVARVGAIELHVRDAESGAEAERADVRVLGLAGLPGIVRRGFHRAVWGPLQAGAYDLEVQADGYEPKILKGVQVVARKVGTPIPVALERKK